MIICPSVKKIMKCENENVFLARSGSYQGRNLYKKKKVVISTTNLFVNLKSNTMKNTMQR